MSSKSEKDRQKQIEEKCLALLTQMLRDEDNKYCVDCDAKGPRWASWNLGVFLCIRCAGIHRNLGVHISKVKSVNLDTWTPEQVVSLQQMGNSRARAVYEANIPDNFRRPQYDPGLESFIRAKYETKKYIAREWVPPEIPKVDWDKELDEEAERQKKRKKEAKQNQNLQGCQVRKSNTNVNEIVPQLPKPKCNSSPKTPRGSTANKSKSNTQDLLGLDTPTTAVATDASNEDIFSNFISAPTQPISNAVSPANIGSVSTKNSTNGPQDNEQGSKSGRTAEEESFFNQPAPSSQERRQLTKDSIMALYGTQTPAPQPQQAFGIPGGVYSQPLQHGVPNMAYPMGGGVIPDTSGVVQNGLFPAPVMNNMQIPAAMVSNPFFNMATVHPNQNAGGFPPSVAQVTQQMGGMNMGPMQVVMPQQGLIGGIPTMIPSSQGISAFSQPNDAGHTLVTNLWK